MRPRRKRRRRVLFSSKAFLLCAAGGVAVGFFMIWAHLGPGVHPLPEANTPGNRNVIRTANIEQIGQALVAYFNDNHSFPYAISTKPTQICTDMGSTCASQHLADVGYLMTEGNYLPGIPEDPSAPLARWGSGYDIAKNGSQIIISAPSAELGKTISEAFQL